MKILLISLSVSLLFLTACKSEQEKKEEESKQKLIGERYTSAE